MSDFDRAGKDCDEIARMVMHSRWLRAVIAHAVADPPQWAVDAAHDAAPTAAEAERGGGL